MGVSRARREKDPVVPESAASIERAEQILVARAFKTIGEVRFVLHRFALSSGEFRAYYYGPKSPTEAEALEWIIGRLGEGNDETADR